MYEIVEFVNAFEKFITNVLFGFLKAVSNISFCLAVSTVVPVDLSYIYLYLWVASMFLSYIQL